MNEHITNVDFVAQGSLPDEWKMVIVEEGPWQDQLEAHLRRIQDRLYGCIDAALDGQLAAKFPGTEGKTIVIQLDCYNVPENEVSKFFSSFSEGVFALEDYRLALERSRFVKAICFKITFDSIH